MNAQGIPMFPDMLRASGLGCPPIPEDLGRTNGVRLAGNGFHIACAGSFVGFVLAFLEKKDANWDSEARINFDREGWWPMPTANGQYDNL